MDPPISRLHTSRATSVTLLGSGLPPIPAKLISRIEAGEFIKMAELLPERLNPTRTLFTDEPEPQKTQNRRKLVTNILEWTQYFAMYTAIFCKKYPDKLSEILSYLILIIQTHMQYEGDAWLGYDRRFRQRVAYDPQAIPNLTTLCGTYVAFSGKAKAD